MSMSATGSPSVFAPLVDETKLGSSVGQTMIGVTGIILAVLLVIGQISLATTKGLADHLHQNVLNITEGNKLMESVVERAAASPKLEKSVGEQSEMLASTLDTMRLTNGTMSVLNKKTEKLDTVVSRMESQSSSLASSVEGINKNSHAMANVLGKLPAKTTKTQSALTRINADTVALNNELGAIASKMEGYGLPKAKGAPSK